MVISHVSNNLKEMSISPFPFVSLFNSIVLNCWFLGNRSISCHTTFSRAVWEKIFILMKKLRHKNSLRVNAKIIFRDGYLHVFIIIVTIITYLVEAMTDSNSQQNDLCKIAEIGIISFMLISSKSLLKNHTNYLKVSVR